MSPQAPSRVFHGHWHSPYSKRAVVCAVRLGDSGRAGCISPFDLDEDRARETDQPARDSSEKGRIVKRCMSLTALMITRDASRESL
jgi:hypothetical protein